MSRSDKVLRLALAMGGGVSHGAFAGAAITEALMLAVRFSGYKRVEIDVMSGASAGGMSMAILLRYLLSGTSNAGDFRATARSIIEKKDFQFASATDAQQKSLIALQGAQIALERIWRDEVNLDTLLGSPRERKKLKHEAGLFLRSSQERIAAEFMSPLQDDDIAPYVLANRCLLRFSLSNHSGVASDARKIKHLSNAGALSDALTSISHKDERVFDLHFQSREDAEEEYSGLDSGRWLRKYLVDNTDPLNRKSLKNAFSWAQISATGTACGAFPGAFEPVTLMRYKHEYGKLWPRQLQQAGIDEYPFTYMDGGVFNNEPIREAFRLASYMDGVRETLAENNEQEPFERVILAVDPIVDLEEPTLRFPALSRWSTKGNRDSHDVDDTTLEHLYSLDRLLPMAGSALGAIFRESRVIEQDKIDAVRDRFKQRNQIRRGVQAIIALLGDTNVTTPPLVAVFQDLRLFIENILRRMSEESMAPAVSDLWNREFKRTTREASEAGLTSPELRNQAPPSSPASDPKWKDWLLAYLYLTIDLVMDLGGKSENAMVVGLAPVVKVNDEYQDVLLPGRIFGAFGGLLSTIPRDYEIEVAKQLTRWHLADSPILNSDAKRNFAKSKDERPKEFSIDNAKLFARDLRDHRNDLIDRIKELICLDETVLSGVLADTATGLAWLLKLQKLFERSFDSEVQRMLQNRISEPDVLPKIEIRIEVPSKRFEIDTPSSAAVGNPDVSAKRMTSGTIELITHIRHEEDIEGSRWIGPLLQETDQGLGFHIDRAGSWRIGALVELPLPNPANAQIMQSLRIQPNPILRYQLRFDNQNNWVPTEWRIEPGVECLEDLLKDRM